MEFQLTKTQQTFLDLIEGTKDNYFLNGPPGTGKSVITRTLNGEGRKKNWIVAAPTGLAALNANGKTLHKTFKLPVSDGIIHPTFNIFPTDHKVIGFIKYNMKHLLIDEISMVRADTLDFIDRELREIKGKDLPFGGIQVVVVGDFFQLPPVVKTGDGKALREAGWESPYAFSAKVFETFKVLTLTEILRQKGDRKFIDILGRARLGEVTAKDMVILNDQVDPDPDDIRVQLCAWNSQADLVNQSKLKAIKKKEERFESEATGDWPDYPCDPILKLKVGAQIIVKKNNADRPPDCEGDFQSDIVNGTLGIVIAINGKREYLGSPKPYRCKECEGTGEVDDDGPKACPRCGGNGWIDDNYGNLLSDEIAEDWNKHRENWHVTIEDRQGKRYNIYWSRWERKIKQDMGNGAWEEIVVASFEQIPLALSWAISMHKSQGQTFDVVHIDASKVFASGQLYVAISRCRTLEGITLQNRINKDRFKTDPSVLAFYEKVQEKPLKKIKALR